MKRRVTCNVLDWATATIENVGYTSLEALYADSCALRISFKAFKDGEDFSNEVYEAYLEPSGLTELEATYTVAVKEFIVYGKYDLSAGITGLDLLYALNDATLSNPTVQALTLNADGTFEYRIPYSTDADVLYYSVLVKKGETSVVHRNPESAFKIYEQGIYEGNATYTWTGASNNIWDNAANWTYVGDSRLGYPGLVNYYGYRVSKVCFNTDAEVDLNGQTYYLWDNNRGFEMTEGITVKLKNGTLGFQPHDDGSRITLNFGKANSTLILNSVTMPYSPKSANTWYSLKPVKDATVVLEGDKKYYWRPCLNNENVSLIIRDGVIGSSYPNANAASGSTVTITNAVYYIHEENADYLYGLAQTVYFRDGDDHRARLIFSSSTAKDGTRRYFHLYGTYDMKIPAKPYAEAYIDCGYVRAVHDNAKIVLDVTDFKGGERVLLIDQPNAGAETNNRMNKFVAKSSSLVIKVNGEIVSNASRNARLVWDYSEKKLYYQQDSQNVASIGTAEYPTLGAALEEAIDGATIKVLNNVEITSYLQITKSLTLDLNGKSITRTDSTDNSTALFVNAAGATVTITGDGTVTADHAVYVNAGKVVIENGTFSAGSHAVYVINNGNAEIKGGTFSSEVGQYHYALNEYDQTRDATSIVVTGGTFVGFNPANNTAEGDNTNFCADGYTAVAGEVEGTWVVQKAISELKPGIPVTNISATTEEEAISKVKLTVEVPANANVTKDDYANYFKLVATETSEGSGVWEVAAVLDDTKVTPVIAETTPAITFKDGEVTVNIKNELPGLYYGVRYATTVEAVETTAPVAGFTVTPDEGDTAGFFKVVVDFKPIPEAE